MQGAVLPAAFVRDLASCGVKSDHLGKDALDLLPNAPGAYLLAIRLNLGVRLALPRLDHPMLRAGWYLYAGSARGPGGLAARIRRHFKRHKTRHWHIDSLTHKADLYALAYPAGDECRLVSKLAASPDFDVAIKNFGNSDCSVCASHLMTWRRAGL